MTAIAALLIGYPLSIAPVAFLAQFIYWWAPRYESGDLAMHFYSPLFALPDPMHRWVVEWWNCGTRLAGWTSMQIPALGP
ncbi:MAG TPA: hypothetical protein PK867_01695 [Pirellulales bacterium]|nr:hypothetical protein [Pirellulales bacterium]